MKYLIEMPHRKMFFDSKEAGETFRQAVVSAPGKEITDEEFWALAKAHDDVVADNRTTITIQKG